MATDVRQSKVVEEKGLLEEEQLQRERAEEALRESEERYRRLIELSPDGIMVVDAEGTVHLANPAMLRLLRAESGENVIGKKIFAIIAPEQFDHCFPCFTGVIADPSRHAREETLFVRLDGERFPVEVDAGHFAWGGKPAVQMIVRDITERKRAEGELREREEKYRTILDDIEDGYFEVDIAGNLTFFNDSLCGIIGYSRDEMMGMNNRQYMDQENAKKVFQAFNQVYTTGEPTKEVGWEIIRKDGTRRSIEASVSLARDSEGEPIGFRGIVRDITERKRVQEEIRRRSAYLATLQRINATLRSTLPLREVLNTIVQATTEALGYVGSFIAIPDAAGERLTLGAAWGGRIVDAALKVTRFKLDSFSVPVKAQENLIARAFVTGELQASSGEPEGMAVGVEPSIRPKMARAIERIAGAGGMACVPLRVAEKTVGVLIIVSPRQQLPDEERAMLLGLADQAGLAIENARLYEERRRKAEELAMLNEIGRAVSSVMQLDHLLESIGQEARRVIDTSNLYIALYDAKKNEVSFPLYFEEGQRRKPAKRPAKSGMTEYVINSGKPLMINHDLVSRLKELDAELIGRPSKSWLGVPMLSEDQVIGVLAVQDYQKENAYDESHLRLLSTIANQATIAIENARLFEAVARGKKEWEETFDSVTDGVYLIDSNWTLMRVNRTLAENFGTKPEELIGRKCYEVIHGFDEPWSECPLREVLETRQPVTREVEDPRIGSILQLSVYPRLDDEGNAVGSVHVVRDITQRRRREEEIERRNRELAALNAIVLAVAGTLDLQEVLQTIQKRTRELLGEKYGPVFALFNEADQTLDITLTHVQEEVVRRVDRLLGMRLEELSLPLSSLKPVLREALPAGKPYVANDVRDFFTRGRRRRLFKGAQMAMGVKWIVVLPLRVKGRLIGTMLLFSQKEEIVEEDMELLSGVANQAAIAIENARLYEEEQRRSAQRRTIAEVGRRTAAILEMDTLFPQVVELIAQNFGYYRVHIFQIDPDSDCAIYKAGTGKAGLAIAEEGLRLKVGEEGIVGWVAQHGQPLMVNDVSQEPLFYPHPQLPDTRSELDVPIRLGEKILGVLDVQSEELGAFDESDLATVETLADQLAVAMENARLYEEAQRRIGELSGLHEITQAFSSMNDVGETFGELTKRIAQLIGCQMCFIATYDQRAREMHAEPPGYGISDQLVRSLHYKVDGPARESWNFRLQGPLIANDRTQIPSFFSWWIQHHGIFNLLIVPLSIEGRITGLAYAANKPGGFTQGDARLLTMFASQAAIAIENARLYEAERKRASQLAVINKVNKDAASTLEVGKMMQEVARSIQDGFNYYNVALFSVDEERHEVVMQGVAGGFEHMASAGYCQPLDEGIIGFVARTGRAWLANDVSQDPYYAKGFPEEVLTKSELCVPIRMGDKIIGAIDLQDVHLDAFDEMDITTLETLSDQLAIGIQNARLYEETKRLAATDPLTGVWNRRHIGERLQIEVARARRFGHELSVLVMDIDNLKLFNDTHGHAAGDEVIRTVAQTVLTSCREIDVVGRYGGDEFALILPETDAQGASTVAERILSTLKGEPFEAPDGTKVPISISIGAASYPSDSDEPDRLFSLADAAMYRAKVAGGGQFASLVVPPEGAPEELTAPFDVLQGLLITVDAKDRYTFKHSQDVTEYALALAEAVGLSAEEIRALEISGRLHDIGKIGIPTKVLRKPSKLTEEEWRMVKEHPRLGYLILQRLPQMEEVHDAVLHHHERWDGKGYPDELQGEETCKLARILAVADAYSAMLTDRPYRKALSQEEALEEIENGAGTQFDPELAEIFVDLILSGKRDKKTRVRQSTTQQG